jgi:hypothetical protein
MRISNLLFTLMILIFFCVSLNAGVYIESTNKFSDDNVETAKIYIEKDRIRAESSGTEDNMITIFREDKGLFWVVNLDKKTYSELTKEDLEKLKKQMDDAFKQMEEQFKNMPPEQRKMMEKMMPEQARKAMDRPIKAEYKKKSSGEKVNKWTCSHYEGYVEGKKTSDLWTTDFKKLGIDASDLTGLNAMGKFFEVITKDIEELYMIGSEHYEKEGGFSGMPVKIIDYENGSVVQTMEMQKIDSKSFDAAIFELPSGLKKEKGAWGE